MQRHVRRLARGLGLVALAVVPVAADQDPIGRGASERPLAGTTWVGEDESGPQSYTFEPGGVLSYAYRDRTGRWQRFRNGTWSQEGAVVRMETNGRFAEREGTVWGDRMSGEGRNVEGRRWRWHARRQPAARAAAAAKPD